MASHVDLPTFHDGFEERVLGTLAAPPGMMLSARSVELIPESEWVEFDYRDQDHAPQILDQNGKGACVGHATASAMEWARWLAGMDHVPLSPWFLYSILCNGIDRGSSISEALDLATETGTCKFDAVPYATINPNRLTPEARRDAQNNRIEIGARVTTFEEMMSETQRRRVGNFSIAVGGGFNNLDADGVPPVGSLLNHSVLFGLAAKKGRDGKWLIGCQNSWNTRWGLGGFFNIRKSSIRSGNDAWSIVSARDTPTDPTNPPVFSRNAA